MSNRSTILHINSANRNTTVYPNVYDYRIELPKTYNNITHFRFLFASIYNDNFNVESGKNKIAMTLNGVSKSPTIEEGVYTLQSFMTKLKGKLDDAGVGVGSGGTNMVFTVSENATTKTLQIVSTNGDFTFDLNNTTLPLNRLGFKVNSTNTSSTTYTWNSDIPAIFLEKNVYFIKIKNIENTIESTNTSLQSAFIVPSSSAKMTRDVIYDSFQQVIQTAPQSFNYLEVQLLDNENNFIKVRNDWEIVMEIV